MTKTRPIRTVIWNTKVGRRPAVVAREVARLGRLYNVDVFMLQEAHGYIDALRDLDGYRLIVANGQGEAQGNPILVRTGIPATRRHAIRCTHTWTGPKAGKRHRGRVYAVATIDGVLFIDVHRTRPGWSPAGVAFAEEYDRLLDRAYGAGQAVLAGDQNIGTRPGGDRGRHTPYALSEALNGRIITTSPGRVDYAVAVGITGQAKELGMYGSDHHAVLLTLNR